MSFIPSVMGPTWVNPPQPGRLNKLDNQGVQSWMQPRQTPGGMAGMMNGPAAPMLGLNTDPASMAMGGLPNRLGPGLGFGGNLMQGNPGALMTSLPAMPAGGGGGGSSGGSGGGGGQSFGFAPSHFANGDRYNAGGARPDGRHRMEGFSYKDHNLPAWGGVDQNYAMQDRGVGAFYPGSAEANGTSAPEIVGRLHNKGITSAPGGGVRMNGKPLMQTNTFNPATGNFEQDTIKGFATGGFPEVGKPAIVGENGPEMIVPTAPVQVIPNILPEPSSVRTMAGTMAPSGLPPAAMNFTAPPPMPLPAMGPRFSEVAGALAAMPNTDGRPDGVKPSAWKHFTNSPGFAAMSWENQQANQQANQRRDGMKNEKLQQEADSVAGMAAALKLAHPDAFTPAIEATLGRMKPSMASAFIPAFAGHLAEQKRNQPDVVKDIPETNKKGIFSATGQFRHAVDKPQSDAPPTTWASPTPGNPNLIIYGAGRQALGSKDMSPKAAPAFQQIKDAEGNSVWTFGDKIIPPNNVTLIKPKEGPLKNKSLVHVIDNVMGKDGTETRNIRWFDEQTGHEYSQDEINQAWMESQGAKAPASIAVKPVASAATAPVNGAAATWSAFKQTIKGAK